MRTLLLSLLCLVGCGKPQHLSPLPPPVENPTVALFTPKSYGHGCPVGGDIVTARHIVELVPGKFLNAQWSNSEGLQGQAELREVSSFGDLAFLRPKGPKPKMLRKAKPIVGQPLTFWQYDYSTPGNVFREVRRVGVVVRLLGGYIVVDTPPKPGASGSCMVTTDGEVVGILVWGLITEDGQAVGVGVQLP